MKNSIGIDKKMATELTEELNVLLATYQVFYQNLRGLHWNIQGKSFFELHLKFEEFYNDALIKVDEIAERILTLEGEPLHTFQDYLSKTMIAAVSKVKKGDVGISVVMDGFNQLIQIERKILNLSDKAEDEGTNSLMSDYIALTEKTIWMLRAYLS